jgi:hypothetical protein
MFFEKASLSLKHKQPSCHYVWTQPLLHATRAQKNKCEMTKAPKLINLFIQLALKNKSKEDGNKKIMTGVSKLFVIFKNFVTIKTSATQI